MTFYKNSVIINIQINNHADVAQLVESETCNFVVKSSSLFISSIQGCTKQNHLPWYKKKDKCVVDHNFIDAIGM